MSSFYKNPLISFIGYFYSVLILSTLVMHLSLLELWMIMELSTFVFIGLSLVIMINFNVMSQGVVSYYLVQSGFSIMLLASAVGWVFGVGELSGLALIMLLLKVGVMPLGVWVYPVLLQFTGLTLLLSMTLQKIPLFMLFNIVLLPNNLLYCIIILNLFIGGCMALLSLDLKSLIVSSSIANNSWLLISLFGGDIVLFVIFFFVYSWGLVGSIFSLSSKVQTLSILSLSGLPPFPLFFVKLSIIYYLPISASPLFVLMFLGFALLVSSSYVRYASSEMTQKTLTL